MISKSHEQEPWHAATWSHVACRSGTCVTCTTAARKLIDGVPALIPPCFRREQLASVASTRRTAKKNLDEATITGSHPRRRAVLADRRHLGDRKLPAPSHAARHRGNQSGRRRRRPTSGACRIRPAVAARTLSRARGKDDSRRSRAHHCRLLHVELTQGRHPGGRALERTVALSDAL